MATNDSGRCDMKKQELEDMITCCICTEVYTDPKGLPCLHTFCMKCIQETGLKTNKGPGNEMPCPICRRMFKIPPAGFSGLPKNLFIESLIQMTNVSSQSASSKPLCDACLEENADAGRDIRVADMVCVDCRQKYCEECSRYHRKLKLTKDHKLIEVNEYESGQTIYQGSNVCELHEQKILDVYCADCKTVVCAICFIHDHKHHEGSHVDTFVNDFRKQIENNIQAMNYCRSKAQTKQREFLKVKKDIQERVVKLERDVANRTDELKQLIDKHATSLLKGLCSIRQTKLKEIQMTTDDVEMYLSCLETYNSYCQKILAKGSASDICSAFSNVSSRAMELQQGCLPLTEREIQSINLCFRKSEDFVEEDCDNLVGEIEEAQHNKTPRVSFSATPSKVFYTYSSKEYERKNAEIDPPTASLVFYMENRVESLDWFDVTLNKGEGGLGFSITGERFGANLGPEDKLSIYIEHIIDQGNAQKDGRIHPGDQIIEVNGKSMVGVTYQEAVDILKGATGEVSLEMGRRIPPIGSHFELFPTRVFPTPAIGNQSDVHILTAEVAKKTSMTAHAILQGASTTIGRHSGVINDDHGIDGKVDKKVTLTTHTTLHGSTVHPNRWSEWSDKW